MPLLNQPTSRKNFERAKSLGLKEGIADELDYDIACQKGLHLAAKVVENLDAVPRPVEIRAVHCAIFKEIHPWAGELRATDSKIYVGNDLPGDPPAKLEERLRLLCEGSQEDFAWAGEYVDRQALAIASFHVALKRIQGFEDGSGRTAGVIMERQVKLCFGLELGTTLAADYTKSLVRGLETGDVKELANHLASALKLNLQAEASKIQAALDKNQQDLETVARGDQVAPEHKHQFVHERLEELRKTEAVALRDSRGVEEVRDLLLEPQRQRAANAAVRQAQADSLAAGGGAEKANEKTSVKAALEDLTHNRLEVSPARKGEEHDRLSAKTDSRAAADARARQAAREQLEEIRRKQEKEAPARTESQSHSQSQSY